MSKTCSKKMVIMYIFDILKKYTDENHRLNQKEILDILEKDYNLRVERKAIQRYIAELEDYFATDMKDLDYSVMYDTISRKAPKKDPKTGKPVIDPETNETVMEDNSIKTDFYLERPITDGELRLLIDSLLFSPNISNRQCKELAKKLGGLSSVYFKSHIKHIACLPDEKTDNQELFFNIEKLDEAICRKRKVSFNYTEYGTDKKRRAKKDANGNDKVYIISPYQMATNEGKYYLICNNDEYEDISNFRIDRIQNVEILSEIAKPYEKLQWANGKRLELAAYMKEHIYMYASDSVDVKFKVVREMVTDVIDIFGKNVKFLEEEEKWVTVRSKTNEKAMLQFAKRHIPDVEILEPLSLREKVKTELERALERYEKEEEEK